MFRPDQHASPTLVAWARLHVPGFAAACSADTLRAFARSTGHAPVPSHLEQTITAARRGSAQIFTVGVPA